MSVFSAEEITLIETSLQIPEGSFKFEIRPEFGANNSMHRMLLKSQLRENLLAAGKEVPTGTDPLKAAGAASVSHTDEIGGFAWLSHDLKEQPMQIGMDIEVSSRVHEVVAKRICKTETEFKSAPSPSSLWVAKEAGFKSLRGSKQPQVLSEIEVTEWQTVNSQVETCCLKDPQKLGFTFCKGIVLKKNAFKISFFTSARKTS